MGPHTGGGRHTDRQTEKIEISINKNLKKSNKQKRAEGKRHSATVELHEPSCYVAGQFDPF